MKEITENSGEQLGSYPKAIRNPARIGALLNIGFRMHRPKTHSPSQLPSAPFLPRSNLVIHVLPLLRLNRVDRTMFSGGAPGATGPENRRPRGP